MGVILSLKKAVVVIIWGIAFGFVEASVVEYLRAIYYPLSDGGFHFPILTLAELQKMGPEHIHRLEIEIAREFSIWSCLPLSLSPQPGTDVKRGRIS